MAENNSAEASNAVVGERDNSMSVDCKKRQNREIRLIKLGAKGTWYVKWNDGSTASQGLPAQLQAKIHRRSKKLPEIISLSISADSQWLVIFADGSFSSSILQMSEKLKNSLMEISEPVQFVFAPFSGWVLIRKDGSMSWERLPTSLDELLSKRSTSNEPAVKHITINAVGGWFVQFSNNECAFGGIPEAVETALSPVLSKKDPDLIVEFSLLENNHYFIQSGLNQEWANGTKDLSSILKYARGEANVIPDNCVFEDNEGPSRANSMILTQ